MLAQQISSPPAIVPAIDEKLLLRVHLLRSAFGAASLRLLGPLLTILFLERLHQLFAHLLQSINVYGPLIIE